MTLSKTPTVLKILFFKLTKSVAKCDRFFCFDISSTHPDILICLPPLQYHFEASYYNPNGLEWIFLLPILLSSNLSSSLVPD
jgi:hypothetical protein